MAHRSIAAWFALLFVRARAAVRGTLGAFSWTPPPWMRFLHARVVAPLRAGVATVRAWVRAHPRQSLSVAVAAIVLLVASSAGYLWYQSLPKPVELTLEGNSPTPTKLEDNAKPEPIYIEFSGPAARLEQVGKIVTQGITMKPAVAGEWRWASDSRLIFTPREDWAVGQTYTVDFDHALFPEHVRLAEYRHRFSSAPFTAEISQMEFYQDPTNPKLKKVVATLRFSHPVATGELEKRITLRMAGQKEGLFGIGAETYRFTVNYDKFKGEAYVHSDPIAIPMKDSAMTLSVAAGVKAERGGSGTEQALERQVAIPGMYNFFRISTAGPTLVRNERYEPEQVLVIQATAGVADAEIEKNLSVYQLPKDLPAVQDRPAVKNYRWYDASQIGPEILSQSTRVALEPLPTDREYAPLHSFRYQAEPGRFLYIRLNKGIASFGGYVLAKEFDTVAQVPAFPREIGIMHDGALLSLSGDKKLSVFARDVEAVRFDVGRVLPDQINHLVSQTGGQFRSPYFSNYQFSEDNISERFSEVRTLIPGTSGKAQYFAFDFARYLGAGQRGLFFFHVQSWDPVNKRTTGMEDKRFILITDLGLLVKDSVDGSHDVFVQSIHSGLPVAGATVEVVGKNGLAVASAQTDADGHASFPKLTGFMREKTPTVYLVRKGSDTSFLPYTREDRMLNFSRFDIGGEVTRGGGERLYAYLFSDRGIYRPGDEFHIGLIVKPSDWHQNVAGLPLETVITDPRGLEVAKRKIALSPAAFEEIRHVTEETAPTGTYQVSVYVVKDGHRGALLGSTSVRVEEFLPDRMQIATHFSQERSEGWVSPQDLIGRVALKNLFGTPATDRRVAAQITLSPTYPAFRAYQDYTFYDPLHAKRSFSERLQDQKTNDKGESEFVLPLARFDKATYRLTFTAEGYEAQGGRSVTSASAVLVSPLPYLVGYKSDGELRYISKGGARSVDLIAIDPTLKRLAVKGLKARVIEERYVSALAQQSSGVYKYQSVRKELSVSERPIALPATGLRYRLPTDRAGNFVLIVQDKDDTELNRVAFSVVGQGNLTRNLEKNAELQVKLNKSDYAPGEEIEMEIKAPYVGAGLITIERDYVYAHRWFKTTTTGSVQKIRVPANFEGNGYVTVTFVRAIDSREIYMSPLSYGVAPFSVSRARRTNAVTLDAPDVARPGEPFHIRYRAQRPGKIVVFAVDEGILQVANYTTPDPLSYFFRKRALEVRTAQILDMILPEYSIVQSLAAPGGDEEGRAAIGKNLNPFKRKRDKAVVYWSGILSTDAGTHELTYQVPDYFSGTLRVMAVAVAPDAVGVAQRKAFVRGPFVLNPNVPTSVAPHDEFEVSVGVANNIEGSGKEPVVHLALKTSEHLQVLDGGERAIKIGETREGSAVFHLRAKSKLGSGNITVTASLGKQVSHRSVDLSVRPSVPYMVTLATGHIKDSQVELPVSRRMYSQYRTLETAVSPLPLGIAHGLVNYLRRYPYGCTEQLVSQAFPAIVLRSRPEFGYAPETVEANLERAVRILRARQNAEGAFGFWAANSHVSDMQTVYALHFLTEARERNYAVPPDLLEKGLRYLHALLRQDAETLSDLRIRAYAVYVLTRNGVVTTNYIGTLQERLDRHYRKVWRQDLAGAYLAASYKMLRLNGQADDLIRYSSLGAPQQIDYANYYDGLVHDAQYLYLLARHFPERLDSVDGDGLAYIVKAVADGRYNSLSSAYTILALDAYAQAVGAPKPEQAIVSEIGAGNQERPLILPGGLFPRVDISDAAQRVRIRNRGDLNLFYQLTQSGFDRELPKTEIKRRLEVQREYRDAKGAVIDKAKLGEEIEVHLKIRTLGDALLPDVAVADLLPGGFEVVTESLNQAGADGEQAAPGWRPDYADVREDRVVLFGAVTPSAGEFVYRIKATNEGKYAVPPTFAESMYDRTVQARGLGGVLIVEGP